MRHNLLVTLISAAAVSAAAVLLPSCHHVDNRRLPGAFANIMFWTQADWVTYGVSGAAQYRIFNKAKRMPSGFNYLASSMTGLGGVLLCSTYTGEPVAYDLACPNECRGDITVFINEDNQAECPRCHSLYDVFGQYGAPVGGPAAHEGYGMEVYSVTPGPQGEYMVIRNR